MTSSHHLKTLLALFLSSFAVIAISTIGCAQNADAKSRILTQKTIKQFVASYPAVKAIAVKHAAEQDIQETDSKVQLLAVIQTISDEAVMQEVEGAIRPHGFSDAREWASIGESIARAYAHIKAGSQKSKAERKLEKAIRKIEKSVFLSGKQKANLIKALREGANDLLEPPPPENIAAVEPMIDEIEAMMN